MGINLGSTAISAVYLGNTAVSKVYLGTTEVWSAAPAGAHYTDNFNRSNSGSLGASWTNWAPATFGGGGFAVASNQAVNTFDSGNGFYIGYSEYNSVLTLNNHKVAIKLGSTVPDLAVLYLRGDVASGQYVAAYIDPSGGFTGIAGVYVQPEDSGPLATSTPTAISLAASDNLSFEVSGTTYTVKQNGSTVHTWTDSGGVYTPYTNSGHRKAAVAMFSFSAAAGFDDFDAQDI